MRHPQRLHGERQLIEGRRSQAIGITWNDESDGVLIALALGIDGIVAINRR